MTYNELRVMFPKIETGNAQMISEATHGLIDAYEQQGLSPDDALERISNVYEIPQQNPRER